MGTLFNFLRTIHTVLHSGFIKLHSGLPVLKQVREKDQEEKGGVCPGNPKRPLLLHFRCVDKEMDVSQQLACGHPQQDGGMSAGSQRGRVWGGVTAALPGTQLSSQLVRKWGLRVDLDLEP